MTVHVSRRLAIKIGIVGAAMTAQPGLKAAAAQAQPAARNSMFPEGHLKVLGFIDQPDRDWYESIHAPDFLSFAAPHMARYARNWITGVRHGPKPAFSVLTEIHFASEAARSAVRALMATPAARPLLDHTMEQRAKRGIVDEVPLPGLGLYAVTPQPDMPHPADSLLARQAVLLRRADGTGQGGFEAAARAVAAQLSDLGTGVTVAMDLVANSEEPAPADAVIYVAGASGRDLPVAGRTGLDLVGIFDVETVNGTVGGATAS